MPRLRPTARRAITAGGQGRARWNLRSVVRMVGRKRCRSGAGSGDFAGGFFEEVVDQGLVRFGLFGGHAAELAEQLGGDADGDELLGATRDGASDAARAAQLSVGGFRNVGEVDAAIWNRPCALCASRGAR